MDFLEIIIITFHITSVLTKKKYISSSDESIENLLYYRDCQHKNKEQTTTTTPSPPVFQSPEPLRSREPDCPFPRMCCALSCGNECNNNQQSFMSRNVEPPQQNIFPVQRMPPPRQPQVPIQPPIIHRGRKKRVKPQNKMQPPIGGRRDAGFTKEKIKSLISQDGDIRKILKDLVRVTIQKVDLMDKINTRKGGNVKLEDPMNSDEEYV